MIARLATVMVLAIAGCQTVPAVSSSAAPASARATDTAAASSLAGIPSPDGPLLTYVAFGDSWAYGAHCNGCRPFPLIYAEALGATTGRRIDFVNLTSNGGTAQQLLANIRTSEAIRDDVRLADVVVIAIGGNDLEPAFEASAAGRCGGEDGLDCFREVTEVLRLTFDGLLGEIQSLRGGLPTAIRLLTGSNEFLADPALIEIFGPDFGETGGVAVTTMLRQMQCEVAANHGAICVDLGLALNGPELLLPRDVNTQAAMQLVADAILASGLRELP